MWRQKIKNYRGRRLTNEKKRLPLFLPRRLAIIAKNLFAPVGIAELNINYGNELSRANRTLTNAR